MESMGEEVCPLTSLGPLLVTDLPDSILLHIFSYLPFSSICQVSQVCHRWNQVASDELLWRSVFLRHYKLPLSTTFPEKAVSWRSEFKRLFYHTPAVLVEQLKEHKDEVLHVSFSHNGTMFATCSKDGYVKVWSTVTSPVSPVFKMDMKSRFSWDFTQFSQFNESDTCLLVSGVFWGRLTTSGEIAIFNLQDDFQMQSRVPNKPYDVFGAWFDNDHLLSGTLFSGEGMRSVSSIWLSKASQEVESEMESVSMVLYRFHNVNCSSVRLINVAQTEPLKSEQEELAGCERNQELPCSCCDSHTDCYQPSLLDKLLCKEISEEEFDIENEDWDDDHDGNVSEEGAKKCKSDRSPTFGLEHGDFKTKSEESVSGLGCGAQMDHSVCDRCVSEAAITTSADFHQNSSWLCSPGDGRRCRNLAYQASRAEEGDIFKDADVCAVVADTSNNASLFSSNETSCVSDSTDGCAGMDVRKDEDFFSDFSMRNPPTAGYLQKSLDPSLNDRFCAHSSSIEIHHSSGVASVEPSMDATLGNSLSHCIDLEKEDMYCVQNGDFLSQEFSRREGESLQANMSRESSPDPGNIFTTPESIGCIRLREHPPATDGLSQSFHSSMSVSSESEFASQASSLSDPCFSCDNARFSIATNSSPQSQKYLGQSSEVGTGLTLSQPPASKVPKYSVDSPNINSVHVPVASDPSSSLTCNHQGCRKQHMRPGQAQFQQKRCRCPPEKLLIYTWGSKTFTPHKIGIKRVKWTDFSKGEVRTRRHSMLPSVSESWQNSGEPTRWDEPDHTIEMHGHIVGLRVAPDQRYLYVNCRPWPKNYIISDPQESPPLAQEIEISCIDLQTFEFVGPVFRSHKAFTHSDDCFFLSVDVCEDYVASGAEDKRGYLWDRHYGIPLYHFPHSNVVNCVAINPRDPEMLVTVSDDHSIKVWASRHKHSHKSIAVSAETGKSYIT